MERELQLGSRIRSWWTQYLEGKEAVRIADAATEAEAFFRQDPIFRDGFFESFARRVIYQYGISMLSASRYVYSDETQLTTALIGEWMEYDSDSSENISLARMTKEQAADAIAAREERVYRELERIEVLRRVAEGEQVSTLPLTAIKHDAGRRLRRMESSVSEQAKPSTDESQTNDRIAQCVVCGADMGVVLEDFGPAYCDECQRRYPASLLKAHVDHFDYALGLRTGEVVLFSDCDINGDWVHVVYHEPYYINDRDLSAFKSLPFGSHRGIDLRINDIVWCCDAPYGS